MSDIKEFIRSNVLTTSEVSDILQLGKARLTKLNETGELIPVKKTTQGSLYLRAEVESYKRKKNHGTPIDETIFNPLFDMEGNTRESLRYFKEHRNELGDIISIYIFFNDIDAALNNFYIPDDQYSYGDLRLINNAHMVLRDSNGKEMWLRGCNCGYGGEGPHGSADILKILRAEGIISNEQFTDEYIENLIRFRVITMYQAEEENNTWIIHAERDTLLPHMDRGGRVYDFHNNLVFIQDPGDMWNGSPYDTLKGFETFIPNPVEVRVFPSLEMAREAGYICFRNYGYSREIIYNVIIYDSSNRQIWLHANINEKNFFRNSEVKDILLACGLNIEKIEADDENTFSKLLRWLNTTLRSKPVQPISYKISNESKN